ncbi:hypothetical protein [Paenibacillus sp.]|uniref:hypothetical protein n=1 Tax=Paenibacillus sp. TaxID=58172 RepID=UPI0028A82BCB|nr:hypothetical protein [Paenibacillus sp.]
MGLNPIINDVFQAAQSGDADFHAKIEGGESALAVAIQQGNHNVKEFLNEKGAI